MGALIGPKLRPPRPLRPLVRRAALEERLRAAVDDAVLVLVHGPAGTGKTSLLARWAAAETRPVAWLTADARDADPARFWSHLAGALAAATGQPAPSGVPAGSDLYVAALADRIAAGDHRPVLVLDEYEQVTSPDIHQQLDLLVRGCGERLTTVVAGRVRPPLRLDQLALAGRLATVTWPDLRMDGAEAGALFEAAGVRLPAARVEELVRETGGWAGGLALVAARLRADPDTGPLPGEALADHLIAQVWSALPADQREFLLDVAVLDRVTVPLAAAVHPAGDAAALLAALWSDGTFLLRDGGGGYRLQRLFRRALARRLATHDPDRERAAHQAAARWYAGHGEADDAIDHALRAGDWAHAAGLVAEVFDDTAAAGRLAALERWLAALPDAAVRAAPAGLTDRALDLWCTLGRTDERDRWSGLAGRLDGVAAPARPADVWQLCLPRERGDLARALRQGRDVLGRNGAGWTSPVTATQASISAARALLLAGRPAECRQVLARIEDRWPGGTPPAALRVPVHALRGLAAYRDGDLDTARAEAGRAEQARAACPVPPRPRAVPEHAILAAVADRGGGVGGLRELVAGGLGTDRTMTAFALLVLAAAERDRGRLAAADALLASFPSALGLVDFRDGVAAALDGGGPAATEPLTDRERAVLQYLRSDLSLAEIAAHLYVSVNTVKTHTRHVYRKLGVTGRRQLTRTAP